MPQNNHAFKYLLGPDELQEAVQEFIEKQTQTAIKNCVIEFNVNDEGEEPFLEALVEVSESTKVIDV